MSNYKKTKRASEADPIERARFEQEQKTLPVEKLVFIDEFSANLAMTPAYARAPQGERAAVSEPFNRGSTLSTIGSLSLSGVGPTMSLKGAVDTLVFDAYVEHFLVPSVRPGDIVLLDNVKFLYSERAISLIEAAGARVQHIPASSPDFNPIEECISKIKEALRRAKARTVRKLLNALGLCCTNAEAAGSW